MKNTQTTDNKIGAQASGAVFSEKNTILQDESGYCMELHEVLLDQINLKWGKYNNPHEKILSFCPDRTTVISHFRIMDPAPITNEGREKIFENQFVVYQEKPVPYNLYLAPTKEKCCSFFEVGMPETFFDLLFSAESDFLVRFNNHVPLRTPSLDFTAPILPKMHAIINDMHYTAYQGHFKNLYLEAKTIELFLLQIEQLDQQGCAEQTKLKKRDIECLYEIKQYIELNFDEQMSIVALARKVGINQMKLKTGFKQLFNMTVFGYLNLVRMQEAKRLLLDENMYVNEVADRIGYRYPHHFTAAFKRQFNITPSKLRK